VFGRALERHAREECVAEPADAGRKPVAGVRPRRTRLPCPKDAQKARFERPILSHKLLQGKHKAHRVLRLERPVAPPRHRALHLRLRRSAHKRRRRIVHPHEQRLRIRHDGAPVAPRDRRRKKPRNRHIFRVSRPVPVGHANRVVRNEIGPFEGVALRAQQIGYGRVEERRHAARISR
jgi:hypothetical protein